MEDREKPYDTKPPLAYLKTLPVTSLSCLFGFSVSSKDGCVYFPGPIDLRGFSMSDITIAPDFIQVYGPGKSPARGTKLNRPATITLFHSPAVMKLSRDEARRKVQEFGGQLRYVDTDQGTVEFSVQHFTRYGLDDEDESEEQPPVESEREYEDAESDRFSFSPQPDPKRPREEPNVDTPPLEDSEPVPQEPASPALPYFNPEMKVVFSPSGRLLFGGALLLQLPQTNQSALQLLDLHLECTTREERQADMPVVPRHSYSQLVKMWTGFVARLYNVEDVKDSEYLVQLWSLVNVLFGDPTVKISEFVTNAVYMQETILRHESEDFAINNNDEMTQLKRRQALYYWLKLFCRTPLSPHSSTYRHVLEHMAAANPLDAVALAVETGNFALASLLSQTHRHCFMKLIESQLAGWYKNKADQFMDPELKIVYEVLASNFENVDNFHWKQLFALTFVYGTSHNAPITEAYKKFFERLVVRNEKVVDSMYRADVKDACYQLLQLLDDPRLFSSELRGLLNPFAHSRNLEFGVSWLLSQALSDIYALELFPTELAPHDPLDIPVDSTVTRRFIQELLDSGRWEWAVYVMLVSGFSSRQLSSILFRYVDLYRGSDQTKVATARKLEFFQSKLKIPTRVLAESMALNAEYNQVYEDAFRYYLQANDPESAYDLLIREVGPACIIRYKDARRLHEELLGTIKELEDVGRVLPTLRLSVQSYRDYCDLLLKHSGSSEYELLPLIHEVALSVKKLPTETRLQSAAKSLMMENLGEMYLTCKRACGTWDFGLGQTLEANLYDGVMHGSAELLQTHLSAFLEIRHYSSD